MPGMYELKKLIDFANKKSGEGKQLCLATIIKTVGSSYRKTGTQMVVADDLSYKGALSGGCVESEVLRQSEKVFEKNCNVIFEYDGQYKLGCNGKIYILIEPLSHFKLTAFSEQFYRHYKNRIPFEINISKDRQLLHASVCFSFAKEKISISELVEDHEYDDNVLLAVNPQYQLIIVGGEFDSVHLADLAALTGYKTHLIVKESFTCTPSPSVTAAFYQPGELCETIKFDRQTAIVLMTHSLSKDLNYLMELIKVPFCYMGILGPPHRKDRILTNLMNQNEALFLAYADKIENIHGPVGLDIGGKTPEEISISILGEIISVFNRKTFEPGKVILK